MMDAMDIRFGYCTKHGSTTECLQCTIDGMRAQLQETVRQTALECIRLASHKYADISAGDNCMCDECDASDLSCADCVAIEIRKRFDLPNEEAKR